MHQLPELDKRRSLSARFPSTSLDGCTVGLGVTKEAPIAAPDQCHPEREQGDLEAASE